jgi:hypothetical protein
LSNRSGKLGIEQGSKEDCESEPKAADKRWCRFGHENTSLLIVGPNKVAELFGKLGKLFGQAL